MTTDRFPKARTLVCVLAMLILGSLASAGGAIAAPALDAAPSVSSDKADYAPGELVTLSGAGWGAGEGVHIRVNDDAGSSWSRDVDVTADDAGVIADSFNLPAWFVAEYSVTATGASGSVATTSFTDGNVKVAVVGLAGTNTAGITQTLYAGAGCTGTVSAGPTTVQVPPTDTAGVGSSQSLRLDAAASATGGQGFLNWSKPAGSNVVFTTIAGTNNRSICIVGFQSGSEDITATYAANTAPTVSATNASVTVNEGQTAANSGNYADTNPGDNVTISASRGTVTKTGTNSGTWSWAFATTDGPDQTGPVTITATDGNGGTAATTFTLNVNNVAPTVTLAPANPLQVNEGSTQQTYSYSISDPGADTVPAVTTSCGANGAKVAASDTNTNTTGSFKCTFADGPSTSVVSASATDSDNATGNLATQTVTVNNVAPTVTLTGSATADEGQTKTYSFTVADPGQDTFAVDAGFPDCDAGATNNGTFVAGSLSVNPAGGSFQCFFADGPSSANVKIQVRDSDGASDAASQSVQIVAVANVAPTVTAPANQTANEGASTSLNVGSFTDPGPDSPWAVDVDWGDGSTHAAFNMTLTGTLGSLNHTYADGPATRTVSVKVTDKNGASDTKTFTVQVANVAPTVTAAANQAADEGAVQSVNLGSFGDPGPDSPWAVDVDWGDGSAHTTFEATSTGSLGARSHTFADGPATRTVSIKVTDTNGASDTKTFTVTVANVAPTTTLSGANDVSVTEGSTEHSYSYSITDPGQDTVSSVTTSCGANGAKVAGSDTNTDTSGSFKCTFPDGPSTSVVSATATDSDGAAGNLATQSVAVANVAPTVSLSGPATADEGDIKTYTFTVSDPGADSFTVDSGFPDCDAGATNNGSYVAGSLAVTAAGGSFDCFFADGPATANVKIKVSDSDGASDTASESVQIVEVANVAPSVTAAANQTAAEGSSKTFALGSFTDPGPDSPWAVDVNWGDGTAHTTFDASSAGSLGTRDHSYADSGSYTVSVKVTDSNGDSDTDTFTVTVFNVAPTTTLAAANDVSVNEGSAEHSYSYTITDPGTDTVNAVHTSCGTNGAKVTGSDTNTNTAGSFKCTFADGPASSTVSASATDSDGDTSAADSQTITIANVAPTVTFAAANDLSVNEGSTHTYSYSITDPGSDTVSSVATSCGANATKSDATNDDAGGSFKCTFPDGPASSTVSASATDSDLDAGTEAAQVVAIANVAPTVVLAAGNDQSVNEGTAHTYAYSITDPGADTVASVQTSCGDSGSKSDAINTNSSGSFRCTFPDGPASSTVSVSATDSDHAEGGTDSQTVTVVNVAPTIHVSGARDVLEDSTHTYTFTVSDPGVDTFVASADYPDCDAGATNHGTLVDGSYIPTPAGGTFECAFPDGPATATVKMKVADSDGASATDSESVQIVAVANVAPIVVLAAGNDLSVNEGSAHTYGYSITDPGADTVDSVQTSCGNNGAKVAGSDTNTDTTGSFKCVFPDGPASSTVSASATDSDGDAGAADTQPVAVANVAPTVVLSGANDLSVLEGSAHTYSYSITDPGSDTVSSVATSCGANATKSDASNDDAGGSFKCTFPDGPASSTVTAQATDSDAAAGNEASQTVTVANVAPTVTLAAGNDLSVNEGSAHTYSYTISDPGVDTVSSVATSCGANGTESDATNSDSAGSFKCTFPDGPNTSVVSASATDSDGVAGNLATQAVTVVNVAPTANVTGAGDVLEGSTHTYSFTVTDPGVDTFTVDGGFPDCDAGLTNNGSYVTGSLVVTPAGGSFECFFADGPATANVKIKVSDSDGASDTASESVQIVEVANIAPTATLDAGNDLSVNEGSSHTYTYTITDPGTDTVNAVHTSCGTNGAKVTGSDTNTDTTGSFKCVFPDGPASSTVSASATDSDGDTGAADSQTITIANVAPTTTLSGANDLSVSEGSAHTYSYSITDPGSDTVSSVATSCGANATKSDASNDDAGGSFKCTFPDGPASSTVTAQATDSDAAAGNEASQTVAVANVAPTTTLSGANDVSVTEGSTEHSYSYSITDPGTDTVTAVHTSCGTNGAKVAGSDTNTDTSGSFECTFPDGPSTSVVSATATDSDGAAGNLATQSVTVANVAPTVSLSGPATADEGDIKTYTFTVADPGADSFTVDSGFPDCDAGATNNGSYVAGSLAVTAAGGSFDCFFADGPATANVKIKVSDSDGASDTASESVQIVNVANVAPSVTPAANQTAAEGSSKTFALGSFTDPGPDSPWAVDVNWGDGTAHATFDATSTGTLGTQTHSYADSGSYTVSVKVTDSNGDSDTDTFTVTVSNVAPTTTLAAANDVSVNEGSAEHSYSYTITDPGTDTVNAVHTSCGTNGAKVTGSDTNTNTAGSFKCTFADGPASSTVSASATDSDGDTSAADSQTITIANVAPTVTLTGPATADEGSTKTYTLTVTDPGADTFVASAGYPDCDAATTNNGTLVAGSYTATASGGTFKCFFADGPATATVKMKVADSDGASGTDSESVTVVDVANVAPTVTAPANQAADEGSSKSFDVGSFSDPGPDSPWAVDVNWGDDSTHTTFDTTSTGSLGSRSHTYADGPATRTVSVKVTDKNGGTDTKTFTVTVANVAPTADLGNNGPKPEGSPVTVSFTNAADPSSGDVAAGFHYGFSCAGDATALPTTYAAAGTTVSKDCTFLDNGTYVVKGRVFDRDNGYRTYDTSVTVTNVAPTITSFTGTNSLAGPLAFAPSTFKTDFTDPGTLDTWTGGFTWSSGLPASQTVSPFVTGQKVDHTFTAGCNRTATVKVTDDDGGFDTKSASVNVGTGTWLPPLADQPVSDKLRNGQVLPVKVKIADCNGVAVTGLTPVIQLLKGDLTSVSDDSAEVITIGSVSSADTGTYMRESGGSYMYNLRVNVAAADLNQDFTIIIYPYGTGTPQTLRHVIVATK